MDVRGQICDDQIYINKCNIQCIEVHVHVCQFWRFYHKVHNSLNFLSYAALLHV
jgi:hypothetical protein